jgi:hypothetical protein
MNRFYIIDMNSKSLSMLLIQFTIENENGNVLASPPGTI